MKFTPFAIYSLLKDVYYFSQIYSMSIFRDANKQELKELGKETKKTDDKEIWEHMPEWARMLHQLSKKGKSGMQ